MSRALLAFGTIAAGGLAAMAAYGGGLLQIIALAAAVLLTMLLVLGPTNAGIALIGAAYFFAPFHNADAIEIAGPNATVTEAAFVLGTILVLPRIIGHRLHASMPFVAGVTVLLVASLVSTLFSDNVFESVKVVLLWTLTLLVIPLVIATLEPSLRLIHGFAWTFVGSQTISAVYSVVTNPTASIRHQGLSQHPNAFADGAVMAFALLLYLRFATAHKRIAEFCMLMCVVAVYLSGSRGGTLALAALVALVPFVERTTRALGAFLVLCAGAVVLLPQVIAASGDETALGRFTEAGVGAEGSANRREGELSTALERFWNHPITGDGLTDISVIHNIVVAVAVGAGVFGVVGFGLLVWSVCRPLFGHSQYRRIAYTAPAYLVFGLTAPVVGSRPAWLCIALSFAIFRGYSRATGRFAEATGPEDEAAPPAVPVPRAQRQRNRPRPASNPAS